MNRDEQDAMLFRMGYLQGLLTRADARNYWIGRGVAAADLDGLIDGLRKCHRALYDVAPMDGGEVNS